MARKKVESSSIGAPWLNTFADLMNLLLCFFVLLFALSDVNGEKFEKVSISMANSIGVFKAGGSSIGEGQLISSGVSQLNELDELFNSMGKTTQGQTNPNDAKNTGDINNTQGSDNVLEGKEGTNKDQGQAGTQDTEQNQGGQDTQNESGLEGTQGSSEGGNVGLDDAMARVQEEMVSATNKMYDQVSDLRDQYNLGDYVELSADPEFQYVELTLKGSILFDSGSADIKEAAKPILSKIGELLKKFDGYNVEITGHTDNIPMSSSAFKDNNWLSSARALNAAEYLIDTCGMNPAELKYSGRGEYEPISSNSTEQGRAKNRRIEIKIFNQYSSK